MARSMSLPPSLGDEPAERKTRRGSAFCSDRRQFSIWQRLQIFVMAQVSAGLIYVTGKTLRWESRGDENLEAIYRAGKRAIFTFWHGRIFPATWYWRKRGIVVMTSQNFDGEYIAKCILRHGYGVARGSSSRGGLKALLEMASRLRGGSDVAFTIDGPRGPRYIAKIGPILLAKRTGNAIFCFHISVKYRIQFNNWDHSQIPLPFSPALILKAPPIYVSRDADEAEVDRKFHHMQEVLDQLRREGDSYWDSQ